MRLFDDRPQAGRLLGEALVDYAGRPDVIVLGLARGGVSVAVEVAQRLQAPLDVCVVRKLGVPGQRELAMGAIAAGGTVVINRDVVDSLRIPPEEIEAAIERETSEIARREILYREGRQPLPIRGRTVILVDDGLATGATMAAAVSSIQDERPNRVVIALPVGASATVEEFRADVDEIVCLETPESFFAVGQWYLDFSPTTDDEVRDALQRAGRMDGVESSIPTRGVSIPSDEATLQGDLAVPPNSRGIVLFAHGSGSSRHSSRNQAVARDLHGRGWSTLLMDLLTGDEEERERLTGALRFDIDLLARRLVDVTDWLTQQPSTRALPIGYFGASTGAAAALVAAALRQNQVSAVVSRGGRPDLARPNLSQVKAPTLLIVGGADVLVLDLNREALDELRCEKRLTVVPDATHLFEEPGALERVAELANEWFEAHLLHGAQPKAIQRPKKSRSPARSKH
jgi:putative phosphoribosyl transferase